MMNIIIMISWLTGYIVYFRTFYVLTAMLPNFRQKYENGMNIYMLYAKENHACKNV